MIPPVANLKSVLITGLLIVLPAWLALLMLASLLVKIGVLVRPISRQLPDGINHPHITAGFVLLLLCLIVGILVNTAIGRMIGRSLDENIFAHVPGYQSLRNIARQVGDTKIRDGFRPALIEVEDGCLAPAFLIEVHTNGRSTIFMPSVPTPMAGSIFIMPSERVHPIDVSVTAMMKCITKWGTGSSELLKALAISNPKPAQPS